MSYFRRIKQVLKNLSGLLLGQIVSLSSVLLGVKADRIQRYALKKCGVHISGPVFLGRGVIIYGSNRLKLGERVGIGDSANIACHAPITIGDDFLAASGLYLNSGGHDTATLESFAKPIRIGDRVWCGLRVTICAGVEIGDDVVIGAGSVVVRSIPSRSIAVGVPARVVGQVDRDLSRFQRWHSGQ